VAMLIATGNRFGVGAGTAIAGDDSTLGDWVLGGDVR
jgi:hypothetical protein